MNRKQGIALGLAKWALGVSLAVGFAVHTPQALAAGPNEDEPGWSCVDQGDRRCGPGNSNGVPAGCYDDGGVLEASWPCHVSKDPQTGDTDIFAEGNPIPVYVY